MLVKGSNKLDSKESIENIELDLIELLSRSVVDTTINKVILKTKDNDEDTSDLWNSWINNVNENNDLERLLKTDTKYKSKYGKSYCGFDWYKGKLIFWIGDEDNSSNASFRINGMKTFAIMVTRTYAETLGASILTNRIIYTNKTRSVLFQGGFGVEKLKTDKGNENRASKINPATFPVGFTSLTTPEYIVDAFENGTINHDLGVIQCLEFLNKDVKDNFSSSSEIHLSDWYPAKDFMDLINSFLRFVAWEMNLNHTRVMGLFSQADIQAIVPKTNDTIALANMLKRTIVNNSIDGASSEDKFVNKKLILKTFGGADAKLEIMQSTFDALKEIDGFNSMVVTFYKLCGYSWGSETNQVYENVSQTQNSNKGVFETTKEKIELFTRQWKELLINSAYAFFKKNNATMDMNQVKKEFEIYVDFKLISNVLQSENNDWKKTLEIYSAGVLTNATTLKLLYPEWTNDEIKKEVKEMAEKDKQENMENSFFENEDAFGSEEDKDNNDLNEKEEQHE